MWYSGWLGGSGTWGRPVDCRNQDLVSTMFATVGYQLSTPEGNGWKKMDKIGYSSNRETSSNDRKTEQ